MVEEEEEERISDGSDWKVSGSQPEPSSAPHPGRSPCSRSLLLFGSAPAHSVCW